MVIKFRVAVIVQNQTIVLRSYGFSFVIVGDGRVPGIEGSLI